MFDINENLPLIIKLIISFFVGGLFIALQSKLAEHYPKIGGYIISLPSTLPLSLFFIGWIYGINISKEANQIVPLAVVNILIFTTIFSTFVVIIGHRMLIINILSIAFWIAISYLCSIYIKDIGYYISLLISIISIFLTRYIILIILSKNKTRKSQSNPKTYNIKIVYRGIIAGSVIVISSLLTNYLSPSWGGLFAVFPAAFITNFNFILKSKGNDTFFEVVKKAPEGTLMLVIYSITFMVININSIFLLIVVSYIVAIILEIPIFYYLNIHKDKDTPKKISIDS